MNNNHLDESAIAKFISYSNGYQQTVTVEAIFIAQDQKLDYFTFWINGESIPYPESEKFKVEGKKALLKNREYWTKYR